MYEDDENHEEMHKTALAESKVVEKERRKALSGQQASIVQHTEMLVEKKKARAEAAFKRMNEKTAAAARLPGAQSTKSS